MALAVVSGDGSPQARAIQELLDTSFVICGVIFVIVAGLIAYCVVRFRARSNKAPKQTEGHTRLEIAWTIVAALIVTALFALTTEAVSKSDPPLDGEPDLTVIGHQWWWEVKYRSGAITANEIHIPTGKPLTVRVESADVIHDFFVPDLARKIDAVPGNPVKIQLQADQAGSYLGPCAEYCGSDHAWMWITIVAQSPEDFAAWERHELTPAAPPASDLATSGEKVFKEKTCVRCHAIDDGATDVARLERVAPDLTHLADRTTLGAGVMKNTPPELKRWLMQPQEIKIGSHMPDVRLTDEEADELVAYFGELK